MINRKRAAEEARAKRREERLRREVETELLAAESKGLVRRAGERDGQTVWKLTEAGEASVRAQTAAGKGR